MTLQQLNYAITISDVGSMNKAAEQLYIAQPSLTASIKELEKEIGITIFNRGARGISLTADGSEFISYARQLYQQYENLQEKYISGGLKRKFGVSAQHYSFAVRAFVEMVREFNTQEYEFAIRETKTSQVIDDVSSLKSEIGIIYLSNFNRQVISKMLESNHLEFHHLIDCDIFAYIWKKHPLAEEKSVSVEQLKEYPCLTFEQGDKSSFYYAEEIIDTSEFSRIIKASDRSTMLNLMSGLNGSDYIAVPIDDATDIMEIGYITRKNTIISDTGKMYIEKLRKFL